MILSTLVICAAENAGFQETLYESVSALGTVGLSMSLTPQLHWFSKIILMLLMYTGRVGVLTLAAALASRKSRVSVRKPEESLFIG